MTTPTLSFMDLMRQPPPARIEQLPSDGLDPVHNRIGWAQNGAHGTNAGAADKWIRTINDKQVTS